MVRPLHHAAGPRARPAVGDRACARLGRIHPGATRAHLRRAARGGAARPARWPSPAASPPGRSRWRCSASPRSRSRPRPGAWRGDARAAGAHPGARRRVALGALVGRNRRRYGGYMVHVGIAVLLVGVAASTAFQHVRDIRMKPGDTARVGRLRHQLRQADERAERRRRSRSARYWTCQGWPTRRHADPEPRLLPVARRGQLRPHRPLLQRRVDERARPARQPLAGHLDGGPAGPLGGRAGDQGRRPPLPARRRAARGVSRVDGGPSLPAVRPRRRLPADRVAARGVDLDRRGDRGRRGMVALWPAPRRARARAAAAAAAGRRHPDPSAAG